MEEPKKYGPGGNAKPPGSGRAPGTPNKKAVAIEQILQERAEKKGKTVAEVSAIYKLYQVMDRDYQGLGLKSIDEITVEMSFDAAKHLSQFEAPKKRAVEVTGTALVGEAFVISTGSKPPENESPEQWAERSKEEASAVELEKQKERLAELERQKREKG